MFTWPRTRAADKFFGWPQTKIGCQVRLKKQVKTSTYKEICVYISIFHYVQYLWHVLASRQLWLAAIFFGRFLWLAVTYFLQLFWAGPYKATKATFLQPCQETTCKKSLPFELICAVYLEYKVTITLSDPSHSSKLYFDGLICSVNQEPSLKEVASIWPYMWSNLVYSDSTTMKQPGSQLKKALVTLYFQYNKNSAKRVASIWLSIFLILYVLIKVHIKYNHPAWPRPFTTFSGARPLAR